MAQGGDPRVAYYAAGVLVWAQQTNQSSFAADDPLSWRFVDEENDPFNQRGHYLPNATLRALGLELLVELGAAGRLTDRYGPDMYTLENRYILRRLAEQIPGSPFEYANRFGERWITGALDKINLELESEVEQTPAPPKEDEWEPLQIDLSDSDVLSGIDEIEQAIQAIAADNGFAVAYPVARDAIISDATGTLENIKSGKATRGQVWRNLVSAGRWVAEKFSGSAIGTAGTELVKWALRLLGVPI